MNASFMNKHTKLTVLSGLLAGLFSLSAHATLYPFDYSDSGPIPQTGVAFSAEHGITGIASSISSIELVLTFYNNLSLSGNSSGIQGLLTLGTATDSPFVSFSPTATSSSGTERIYDVTFPGSSGSPGTGFNGLNPNSTWSLVLWDNSTSGVGNGLVGWTLDVTAVPEPVNVALGIFAGVFLVVILARSRRVRNRVHGWCVGINQWLDAV
jgi:hypothetical protein